MKKISSLHKTWMKDKSYRKEYETLEEEFALASAMIAARSRAGLTQAQLAKKMKTTQSTITRLESGKSTPSGRTLQNYATATGSRLKIAFEATGKRA
jgi:ribosome-binding protein aMBF1 (putative translation factor)